MAPRIGVKQAGVIVALVLVVHFAINHQYLFHLHHYHHHHHKQQEKDLHHYRHGWHSHPHAASSLVGAEPETQGNVLSDPTVLKHDTEPTTPDPSSQPAPSPPPPSPPPPPPPSPPPQYPWSGVLPAAPASITVSFGSNAVADFILNWVAHVQRVPELQPYAVVCMDQQLLEICRERNIPAFLAQNAGIIAEKNYLGTQPSNQVKQELGAEKYYRTDGAAFKKMGAVKARALEDLLSAGYDVLISDADTVWFGNPWPVIGRPGTEPRADSKWLAQADVLVSTDCIDYGEDLGGGLIDHEHNTGILFLRATPRAVEFTREWQKRALETTDGHDQSEFNRILKGMYLEGQDGKAFRDHATWPYVPVSMLARRFTGEEGGWQWEEETPNRTAMYVTDANGQMRVNRTMHGRIFNSMGRRKEQGERDAYWMWHGSIKVGIFPMAEFLNGHLFFSRRLQEYSGIQPLVVHLTYQFGDTHEYMFGKRQRLREASLWAPEQDDYFTDGRFLAITDVDAGYEEVVAPYAGLAGHCEEADPVKTKCWHPDRLLEASKNRTAGWERDPAALLDPALPHIEAHGWLRGVLRGGLLLSHQLGADVALILPQIKCWCERHWWIVDDCRVPSGRVPLPLPFECPMDHQFEPSVWYKLNINFREPSFLSNPRVPQALKAQRRQVFVDLPAGSPPSQDEAGVHVAEGSTFKAVAEFLNQVEASMQQEERARLIQISAADLRRFSTCYGKNNRDARNANDMMMGLLGGFQTGEFCLRGRNKLLGEVGPALEKQGIHVGKGLNCSYPGKPPVTSNPESWWNDVKQEDRQAWIGEPLKYCKHQ